MNNEHIERHFMSGAGNLFTVIDNRIYNLPLQELQKMSKQLCSLSNGETVDGLIAMKNHPDFVFEAEYINPDGSAGSMCGNGSRCAVLFAVQHFLHIEESIPLYGSFDFMMANRMYHTEFSESGKLVRVHFPVITDINTHLQIEVGQSSYHCSYVFNGSDHCIIDASLIGLDNTSFFSFDLAQFAPALRYHSAFGERGANITIALQQDSTIYIRTYERGVEAETGACGTGAMATAISFHTLYDMKYPITIIPTSKEMLTIGSYESDHDLYLEGPAIFLDEQDIITNIKSIKA